MEYQPPSPVAIMNPENANATMILTCGQLRLTIPRSAEMPRITLRPESEVVDVSFTKFSGTVSFETMSGSNTSSQTEAPSTSPEQAENMLPPTLEQSLQTSIQLQPPVFSQPLPMPLISPPSPSTASKTIAGHFLAANQSDSMFCDYSQLNQSQMPASPLLDSQPDGMLAYDSSQVVNSSMLESQHQASQSLGPDSQPAESNPSESDPSQSDPSQPNPSQPDCQFPESHPSQSDSILPSTPPMPHFATEASVDVPPSPPSSHESDDDMPHMKPLPPPAMKSGLRRPHPSALARVDKRLAKHGKRVRFEENPAVLSTPPRKKLAVDTRNDLPSSPENDEANALYRPVTSKSPKKTKGCASPGATGKAKKGVAKNPPFSLAPKKSPKKGKAKALSKALTPKALTPKSPEKSKSGLLLSPATPNPSKVPKTKKSESETTAKSQPSPEASTVKEKKNETNGRPAEKLEGALTPTPISSPGKTTPWDVVEVSEAARPAARWGATFTPLDKLSVLLVGGESEANGLFRDAVVYEVEKSAWIGDERRAPNMPSVRAWHSATQIDNIIFVFGGETGGEQESQGKPDSSSDDEDRTQCNSALVYDKTYRTWYKPSLTGSAPMARAGHCAALIPGTRNVAIYGGINRNKWLNDLHVLEDTCNWVKPRVSTKSARPAARSYATLTTTAELLVLFGGNNKNMCFNDVHLLLPDSMTWVEPVILGRAPKPRTGHCAVASKDGRSVIVYGGWDDQGATRLFYSDVWVLRIESKDECMWTCLHVGDNASRSPGPRAGASICGGVGEEEDGTLLFGGWHQVTHFNDVTQLQVGPNGRVRARCSR